MTNPNVTHLLLVSDRSGSMMACRTDAEGGINAFLAEHKKADGETHLTFYEFDNYFDLVYNGDLTGFTGYTLSPRGGTALLDAIGRAVTELGEALAALPEDKRPGIVQVLISTDGHENASREWTKPRIKELLERQQNQWKWQVTFIGANMDAVHEASQLGIMRGSSLSYDVSNSQGTYAAAARSMVGTRNAVFAGEAADVALAANAFTEQDRAEAMDTSKRDQAKATSGATSGDSK